MLLDEHVPNEIVVCFNLIGITAILKLTTRNLIVAIGDSLTISLCYSLTTPVWVISMCNKISY